jgi:hypothetical protein
MPRSLRSLSPGGRVTLEAVVRTVLPHVVESGEVDVARMVEDRLLSAPPAVLHDLAHALTIVGSSLAGLVVTGRWKRFGQLPEADRGHAFQKWATSAIPQARSVHQALRRFVMSSWYATPAGRAEIGLLPPLHTRTTAWPWEGPLEGGATLDSEPVARQPHSHSPVPRTTPLARQVPANVIRGDGIRGELRLTADVVVIGSGAGGAVAAARLAEAGRDVIILESGDYLHAPDFIEVEDGLVPRLYADQALRTTVDGSISLLQGGAVGCGTTVNWMLMLRPSERVLQGWSQLGVDSFSLRELAPHLDRPAASTAVSEPAQPAAPTSPSPIARTPDHPWSWRFALQYVGQDFAPETRIQHGVGLAARLGIGPHAFFGLGASLIESAAPPGAPFSVQRIPIGAHAGYRIPALKDLFVDAELGLCIDVLTRRASAQGVEPGPGPTTQTTVSKDDTRATLAVCPRARAEYKPARILGIFVGAGVDLLLTNLSYQQEVVDAESQEERLDLLRPYWTRPAFEGGIAVYF